MVSSTIRLRGVPPYWFIVWLQDDRFLSLHLFSLMLWKSPGNLYFGFFFGFF